MAALSAPSAPAPLNLNSGSADAGTPILSPSKGVDSLKITFTIERNGPQGFGLLLQPWTIEDLSESGKMSDVEGVDFFRGLLRFAPGGIAVQDLTMGSTSEAAGLRRWDVIQTINSTDVTNMSYNKIQKLIKSLPALTLEVLRDDRIEARLSATNIKINSQGVLDRLSQVMGFMTYEGGWGRTDQPVPQTETGIVMLSVTLPSCASYGLTPANFVVGDLSTSILAGCESTEEYKYLFAFAKDGGIPIVAIADDSIAYHAGVLKFDVVQRINGESTATMSVQDFATKMKTAEKGVELVLLRDIHMRFRHTVMLSPCALSITTQRKWQCLQARLSTGGDSAVSTHEFKIRRSRFGFGFVPVMFTICELDTTLSACAHRDDFFSLLEFAFDGGLPVGEVIDGSPADTVGLKRWDVIQWVNGEDVRSWPAQQVRELVKTSKEDITLIVLRSSNSAPADAQLRQDLTRQDQLTFVDKLLGAGWLFDPMANQKKAEEIKDTLVTAFRSGDSITTIDIEITPDSAGAFGFNLQPVNMSDMQAGGWSAETAVYEQLLAFASDGGAPVMTVTAKSPAEAAGLLRWDVVQFVNGVDVRKKTVADIKKLVQEGSRSKLVLKVLRDPTVEVRFGKINKTENPGLLALVGKGWLWGRNK